jgi:hypothetical protein
MARGWESKSVEDQVAAAEAAREARAKPRLSAQEREALDRKRSLLLSRAQVRARLAAATNENYRKQLEQALKHLDEQLEGLSRLPNREG